MKSDVMVGV